MIRKGTLFEFLHSHANQFEVLPFPEGEKGFQYRLRDASVTTAADVGPSAASKASVATTAADVLPGSASKDSVPITDADAGCRT